MRNVLRRAIFMAGAVLLLLTGMCLQGAASSEETEFTQEELAYIAGADALKVGYVADRIPVSFQDVKGQLNGISRKIFDRIQEISGLSFEYVALPPGDITYDYLWEEKFDLVTSVEYNEANKNSRGILMSIPYLTSKKVIVGRKDLVYDQNAHLQIAVSTGSQTLKKVLAEQYPNYEIVDFETIEDCFEAVRDGKVDVLLLNQFVAEYWMASAKYADLKVVPVIGLDDQVCFSAVTPIGEPDSSDLEEKEMVISILDKTIAQVSEDEVNNFIIEGIMENQYSFTVSDFVYRYRYGIILFVVGVVLLCILVALLIVFYLKEVAARSEAKAQRRFLSSMSHEMRTPLNGMMGLNQLMAQNLHNADKLEGYVKQANFTTRYLLSLVSDVLEMAELQDNKVEISHVPFSLSLVMEAVESIENGYMRDKGLKFSVDSQIGYPELLGDGIRVQQVILNMLDNARKFTSKGGAVDMTLRQEMTGDGRILTKVRVKDTGCGMSREFQEKIFHSFTQERDTVSKGNQGTGLGMAISYRVAKLMDGNISVDSLPGEGSDFEFTFRADLADDTDQSHHAPKEQQRQKVHARKERVLVAEDNELNAEILAELLGEEGYTVTLAENGQKAVDLFAVSEPGWFSFILMDLMMPVKDGYEAARAIRALKRQDAKTVKIFACTANTLWEDREKALASGMDDFVPKPVDINKLLEKLK